MERMKTRQTWKQKHFSIVSIIQKGDGVVVVVVVADQFLGQVQLARLSIHILLIAWPTPFPFWHPQNILLPPIILFLYNRNIFQSSQIMKLWRKNTILPMPSDLKGIPFPNFLIQKQEIGCFLPTQTNPFLALTRILPVPVWPDISSPAQSFASDMKSPSGRPPSGFWPWSWWKWI